MIRINQFFFIVLLIKILACNNVSKPAISVADDKFKKKTDSALIKDSTKTNFETPDTFSFKSLIPTGYELLDSATGNLNLDSIDDLLLVVKIKNEQQESEKTDSIVKRLLIIATGNIDKTYTAKRQNKNIILCAFCGGAMGDPFAALVIKNGFFSVEHYGGSSWRWSRTTTFRFNTKENDWLLHKDGIENFHSSEPGKSSSKLKTSKETGRVLFSDFDIYKEY